MHRKVLTPAEKAVEKEDKLLLVLLAVVVILLVITVVMAHMIERPQNSDEYKDHPLHLLMDSGHLAGV
jgi:hypothetical protein